MSIYNRGGERKTLIELEKRIKEREGRIVVGGDFNARIEKGGIIWNGEEEEEARNTEDEKLNALGKVLLEMIGREGWGILNGSKQGDEER